MQPNLQKKRAEAVASLIFIKVKWNEDIKGWTCADGKKQWEMINKEDMASPTVSTYSVFITTEVDKHEGWQLTMI